MQNVKNRLGWLERLTLTVVLSLSVVSLYFGVTAAWSDAVTLQARWQISQWQQGKQPHPKLPEWGRVRNDLAAALSWSTGDPQLFENLGYLYGIRAASSRGIPELEHALLIDSIGFYRKATTLRPMSPYAWANLALGLHLQEGAQPTMWPAYDRAYRYGNRESGVQRILAEVGFSRWEEAGSLRQAQLVEMIGGAYPHAKGELIKIAQKHGKEKLFGL